MGLNRQTIGALLFLLLVVLPPFLSIFFEIIRTPLPAYLFSIMMGVLLLMAGRGYRPVYIVKTEKWLFYLFFLWLLIGCFYGDSVVESKNRLFAFFYLILIPVLLIEIYFSRRVNVAHFIAVVERSAYSLAVALTLLLLIPFLFFRVYVDGRLVLPGLDNPIWLTRFAGMLVLILIYCRPLHLRRRWLHYIVWSIACLLMLIAGSRTPVLSMLFCLLLIGCSVYPFRRVVGWLLLLAGVCLLGFLYLTTSYLFDSEFYSLYDRMQIFDRLSNMDFNHWIGIGSGSFGLYMRGVDEVYYPHNSFLEVFVENGFVGLLLYIALVIGFLRRFRLNVVTLLALYAFINSLASGNIPGNNLFYILLYISYYIPTSTLTHHYRIVKHGKRRQSLSRTVHSA